MTKIDTHGLTIKGLKKASGETKDYGCYSNEYQEIFYNRTTGEVWTVYQYSIGQNTRTNYDDANIIKICNTSSHMSMQAISDAIYEKVTQIAALQNIG